MVDRAEPEQLLTQQAGRGVLIEQPDQAQVIPVSQNRRSRRDRLTAERNCEVNLKAVLAIMLLHDKLIS